MCVNDLLANNRQWAAKMAADQPELMAQLAQGQAPKYLWIGCADSRVPASQIVGAMPGDLFVHRNVANQVKHLDFNCQSAVQYSIDVLKVEHVIICGHYACGGVQAAMGNVNAEITDYWLTSIKDSCIKHEAELAAIADEQQRFARMCEINVMDQVENMANSKTVRGAWARGQVLQIHGWIYDIATGKIKDLHVSRDSNSNNQTIYNAQ